MTEHDFHHLPFTCPFCAERTKKTRAFAVRSATEETSLWECPSCESSYLDPQPSDSWLADEYKDYYSRRSNSGGDGKENHFRKFFANHPVRDVKAALEVGGGEGACAREFLNASPQGTITVVEANAECAPFYAAMGARCRLERIALENWITNRETGAQKFDLILCFDVLEHLRQPSSMLTLLVETSLRDRGEIWATFPNYQSLSRRLLGRLWPQYKVEHLYYFSRGSIERLCKVAGLEIVELKANRKFLSIGYFLGVGINFGPQPTRLLFKFVNRILPRGVLRLNISLLIGEWLLIARRKPHAQS